MSFSFHYRFFHLFCNMYLVKSPWWLRLYYSQLTWRITSAGKEIFLTFDDGPHPSITPMVLDVLKNYGARATFFCIGKNVKLYPEVYKRIIDEGHSVGNHTYSHVNGWKTEVDEYLANTNQAKELIGSNLFRPPYGRITKAQISKLKKDFRIIMWDVLSADFDTSITKEKCLQNVVKHTVPGSIIVFHDSEKAKLRLEYALPKALEYFTEKGFVCKAI